MAVSNIHQQVVPTQMAGLQMWFDRNKGTKQNCCAMTFRDVVFLLRYLGWLQCFLPSSRWRRTVSVSKTNTRSSSWLPNTVVSHGGERSRRSRETDVNRGGGTSRPPPARARLLEEERSADPEPEPGDRPGDRSLRGRHVYPSCLTDKLINWSCR